ncbi:hypothetical protein VNO78_05400 [Psophocarpus tetragonolobus]|uniref:RNA-binding protein 48 n=1 Tax=Psophocarpus tetragonolobus TaxID=3891 RepID=A0AAN9STS2_PSOTE
MKTPSTHTILIHSPLTKYPNKTIAIENPARLCPILGVSLFLLLSRCRCRCRSRLRLRQLLQQRQRRQQRDLQPAVLLILHLHSDNSRMPRYKEESPAVRVYTVCDESRYLIVKNVPELGCGDQLLQLFSTYGEVEECKPMDAEDCEKYTDVFWIKFCLVSNARFAKRKLDDFVFFGNKLQVSYAPHFESLLDTMDKLEGRKREVLARLNPRRSRETIASSSKPPISSNISCTEHVDPNARDVGVNGGSHSDEFPRRIVSSNEDYFASHSMNQTVSLVRDKLDKIQSTGEHIQAGSAPKKQRVDNRRRI